jgi:hypothetical protein
MGGAAPALLSTYETERHPVAWFSAKYSMTGAGAALLENTAFKGKASEFFPIVGYRYRSQAVLSEDVAPEPASEIALLDREELTGIPGTRVPHVWLEQQSRRISTLDLLDGQFVLLTGNEATRWRDDAIRAARASGIKLALYRIGPGGDLQDPRGDWAQRVGVLPSGAVLLRPDGFVAWRSHDVASAPEHLDQVLSRILCRTAPAIPHASAGQAFQADG